MKDRCSILYCNREKEKERSSRLLNQRIAGNLNHKREGVCGASSDPAMPGLITVGLPTIQCSKFVTKLCESSALTSAKGPQTSKAWSKKGLNRGKMGSDRFVAPNASPLTAACRQGSCSAPRAHRSAHPSVHLGLFNKCGFQAPTWAKGRSPHHADLGAPPQNPALSSLCGARHR